MVGRIKYLREKGKGSEETQSLCGLTVLTVTLYEPQGLSPKKLTRRLERLEQTFRGAGVSRVILPAGFPYAHRLKWVRQAEPVTFYRSVADLLVLGWLRANGISPEKGRAALTGPRLCPELTETARRLCRVVREVRIDVPGEEGEAFAQHLQREFGLPVVPGTVPVDVTVSFGAVPGDLRLWGEEPDLGGLRLWAEGLDLPELPEPQLLALLWEQGRLRREKIRVEKVEKAP